MAISAAKLEANRRNAKKSTGPRTDEGKECSKFNALKHGLRAETLVLPDEDPQDLEDRRAAWTASLAPLSELEQRAVDDAVIYSWRQDRARRAEAARAEVLMADGGLGEEPIIAKEVLDLGRRLFKDRLGPVAFYPLVPDDPRTMQTRTASTSYPARTMTMTPTCRPRSSCSCNQRESAVNGCSVNGPGSSRFSTGASPGSRPTNSKPSAFWAGNRLTRSTMATWP